VTIKQDIGKFVIKQGIEALAKGISSGKLNLFGSVLTNSKTGDVAGYLQETKVIGAIGVAVPIVAMAAGAPAVAAVGVAYAAGKLTRVAFDTNRTTHRIEDKLDDVRASQSRQEQATDRIQAKIDGIGSLEVANLAVSLSGIGISVAGFAALSLKIDGLRHAISNIADQMFALSTQVEMVRQERIDADFSELKTLAQQIDEAWLLTDVARAERQWHDVARDAHKLQNRFAGRAEYLLAGPGGFRSADPFLDAFALANGMRVAALAACNEASAAIKAADNGYEALNRLTGNFGLVDLVRYDIEAAGIVPGTLDWSLAITATSESARPLIKKTRDREAALATCAAPLLSLETHGLTPRQWLEAARNESEMPVIALLESGTEFDAQV